MMYLKNPEEKRFYWQTQNPYIISKEKELLSPLMDIVLKGPLLEIGCGEGANLINLRSMGFKPSYYGTDISFSKIRFASSHRVTDSRFICGDAIKLPFKSGIFNAVLLRDLLHHVDNDREVALKEALRVCKDFGYIFIIEGNGAKFTNRIFKFITPQEKGMRNSTSEKVVDIFKSLKINAQINMKEPFNLFRFFLHYRYGIGVLGKLNIIRVLLDFMEKIATEIISEDKWAYIVCVINKEGNVK